MNEAIHIFTKIDSTRWKGTTYNRADLLSSLIHPHSYTSTLWDENPSKRLKMIGQLPSGELIGEMSVLFLSNPAFTNFVKKTDGVKTISLSNNKPVKKEIYKIVPITEDDSPDSFGIKIEGEETKFFSYCNYIDDNCKNPIEYQEKDEGIYIGEMSYFYKDISPLFLKLRDRFTMLLSYVKDFDSKTQAQKHLESMLPKIIQKLNLVLDGKNVTESLKMYLSLIKMNLNVNDNTIINEIEAQLKKNKPKRYLHGYGTWYQTEGIKLNSTNYTLLDYTPYRKELRGLWSYNNLEGPCVLLNSSNDKINFKISYIDNHNEVLKYSFYTLKSSSYLKIGIRENNQNNIIKTIKIPKDTNQYTIESILTQECLRYLIELYLKDQENKNLYSCMSFLSNHIINHNDFINNTDILTEDSKTFYEALICNEVIKKLFLKNISIENYYKNIIGYISSCITKDNYVIAKEMINKIDPVIRSSYKDYYGDTLLHMASYLSIIDKEFSLNWIKEMTSTGNMDINSVDNTNKSILHSFLYNIMTSFGSLIDDEEYVKDVEDILIELLKIHNLNINKQDDNGLSILHLVLMLKLDKIKELITLILNLDVDLTLKSSYPVEATPIQIAILFKQDKSVIDMIGEKLPKESFHSQAKATLVSHVKDIYNSNIEDKEEYDNKLNINYEVTKEDESKDDKEAVIKHKEEDKENGEIRLDSKEEEDKEDTEKDDEKDDDERVEEEKKEEEDIDIFEKIVQVKNYSEIKDIILEITDEEINNFNKDENTIGHLVLQNNFIKNNFDADEVILIFRRLQEKNYNINSLNNTNESPLLLLFKLIEEDKDIYSVAKVFLDELEADPDNTNDDGLSPLIISVKKEDEKLTELLLDYDGTVSEEVEKIAKTIENEKIKRMII